MVVILMVPVLGMFLIVMERLEAGLLPVREAGHDGVGPGALQAAAAESSPDRSVIDDDVPMTVVATATALT